MADAGRNYKFTFIYGQSDLQVASITVYADNLTDAKAKAKTLYDKEPESWAAEEQ